MSYINKIRKRNRAMACETGSEPTQEELLFLPVDLSAHKSPLRSHSMPETDDHGTPSKPSGPPPGPLEKLLGEWGAVLSHPSAISLIESLFCQPAYLAFFGILVTYILGYFHFNYIFALLFSLFINFAASRVIKRVKSNAVHKDRKYSANIRKEMYPDKESALWVNNIITAVVTNHHTYISAILLRFLNPVLNRLFAINPIHSLEFAEMDIGNIPPMISNCAVKTDDHVPAKNVKFDFDVDLTTALQGSMRMSLSFLPNIPIEVSNLYFRCRMRLEATFLEDEFPFISPLRVSILEQPGLDISVRVAGLPDFLILPFVTDHYMKVIRRFLYQEIGAPSCVEIDLNKFLQDIGEDSLAETMGSAIPSVLRHGQLNDDKSGSRIKKRKTLPKAIVKTLTPKRSSRKFGGDPPPLEAPSREGLSQSTGSRLGKRDSLRSGSLKGLNFVRSTLRGSSNPATAESKEGKGKRDSTELTENTNPSLSATTSAIKPVRTLKRSKLAQEYRVKDLPPTPLDPSPNTLSTGTPKSKHWRRQSRSCDESSLQQIIDSSPQPLRTPLAFTLSDDESEETSPLQSTEQLMWDDTDD